MCVFTFCSLQLLIGGERFLSTSQSLTHAIVYVVPSNLLIFYTAVILIIAYSMTTNSGMMKVRTFATSAKRIKFNITQRERERHQPT